MRKNDYNSLDEFIGEYSDIRSEKYDAVYGIDFRFNGKLYRMTIDQMDQKNLEMNLKKA